MLNIHASRFSNMKMRRRIIITSTGSLNTHTGMVHCHHHLENFPEKCHATTAGLHRSRQEKAEKGDQKALRYLTKGKKRR